MKRKGHFVIIMISVTAQLASAQSYKNEISTAFLSPLFRNVELIYERQVDSSVVLGAMGRYYYKGPPEYDSLKSNGGDLTVFVKFKSKQRPDGIYFLLGPMVGTYNIAAGYGHVGQGWFGETDVITVVEPRSFLTFGGKAMLGYKLVVQHFSMDFSSGVKFLHLPSEVTDPVNGQELLDAWGNYSWTDLPSPGSIFSLGITAGYRF